MSEPADAALNSVRGPDDEAVEEIARQFGIGTGSARILINNGYPNPDAVRTLSEAALTDLGIAPADIARIRTNAEARSAEPPEIPGDRPAAAKTPSAEGERIVERWMVSARRTDRPKRRRVVAPGKESAEVLRKWVGGDDKALETWIQASEAAHPIPAAPEGPEPEDATGIPIPVTPAPTAEPAPSGVSLPSNVRDREETVVRWLTDLLDRVKSDQFDPQTLLQEVQEVNRQLFDERARRKQLEDELEHVKRGSIAVIKYVRSREAKVREQAVQAKDAEIAELKLKLLAAGIRLGDPSAGPTEGSPAEAAPSGAPLPESAVREIERKLREDFSARERGYIERETELRRRVVSLESDLRNSKSELASLQQREESHARGRTGLSKELEERFQLAEMREKELTLRENELRARFEEIRIASEELERKRVPVAYKEKELSQWEQQLLTTKQALEIEARRIESAKSEGQPVSGLSLDAEHRLEELRTELAQKEDQLKAREEFLSQKTQEFETAQRKAAAQTEAESIHSAAVAEVQEHKARSGVRRLDDLMFGGFPIGAQLLVAGPAHSGKEVLARLFMAEGLKTGIPLIWVVTDKTYTQIRDEMTQILPAYPDFERKGMVRYVDLYSRSLGVTQAETGVRLLTSTDKGVLEQVTQAVNSFSGELKDHGAGYRLAFESVSTVTAYLDTTSTFRFLQPFSGRRKMDGAASYYLLETGMHTESDLQTLEHMMDGSINLKVDQLKTFLSVRGIGETQSRAWIGYTFTKKAFSLGSFSLDHIR
jgi:KaiC/GvpD/RAD55 family RecA-like ATPase